MAPSSIIDSHIHLWPESAANSASHGWMNDGHMLAKQHVVPDYLHAARQDSEHEHPPRVRGVVYIETDRRLFGASDRKLYDWARQPIEEIRFLRSVVENKYGANDSQLLLGLVPWAPLNQGVSVFEDWLEHAEQIAGPETWARVKGFRFLLQGITDRKEFEGLIFSRDFISILKSFRGNGRNYSFDVGIDQHSGGVWQLEAFAKVIEQVQSQADENDKVVFVLNHLCKPDLTQAPEPMSAEDFRRWRVSIKRFSDFPNVYMKISGAFSELGTDRLYTSSAATIADRMKPWLDHVFECFQPDHIMFGSDWPVCNVRGPATEDSWVVWKDVVQTVLDKRGLLSEEQEMIWSGTALAAYRLQL
ncbi:hypothetical protein BDV97DRAFT_367329 [Delphinella strobiligena]|nr:hypothetical protein BDV97DRAFT_367329 [Delphinella strobiligena]